ncbi:Mov34/MPN/PAD-1 family protein [Candidatus Methanomassiliicoccus intestinalis]|uniref:Mov34/MPN/PAD-1 family protein n=1 Tax=Candidatus Methanomassiliicoccus intestinalis TaxID=1406512 RepID=UPI0037DC863B
MSRKAIWAIDVGLITAFNESAKASTPNEFAAAMREEDGVLTELVFLPGSVGSFTSATVPLHMLPIDFSIAGTVHSHPGYSNQPSDEDLHLFGSFGKVHIITCMPYNLSSWRAYNKDGKEIKLEIVDL